jgi:hypothetical protein
MAVKIQLRRGTTTEWNASSTVVLDAGEVGVNTTTKQMKVGDGTTTWASLPYFASGTITEITAGTGIKLNGTAGATSTGGTVTLEVDDTSIMLRTIIDAKGDIVVGGSPDTPIAIPVGTNNYVLTADSTKSTYGLKWGQVATAGIADTAVTTAKIADVNVTTAKIADSAVTSAKIADGTIVNTDINTSAAIAHSKLANATAGQVLLGTTTTGVVTATTVSGDVTISGGGVTSISSGVIVDADISSTAAISKTKISGTAITASDTGTITSTMIADGTILNADINASAAIAYTKLAGVYTNAGSTNPVITISTSAPSGGSAGDIWFKY